jgi:hypothetical protein
VALAKQRPLIWDNRVSIENYIDDTYLAQGVVWIGYVESVRDGSIHTFGVCRWTWEMNLHSAQILQTRGDGSGMHV